MGSKTIIITGLLTSILLIFLCIHFNAEQYYNELGLNDQSDTLDEHKIVESSDIEENLNRKDLNLNVSDNEDEIVIEESKASFIYTINYGKKVMEGELPNLEDNEPLQKVIAGCTPKNNCDNNIEVIDNSEKIVWKKLLVSISDLFEKNQIENGKISVDNERIKIEATFEDQELKNKLSSLLVANRLPLKVYDMTKVIGSKKPKVASPSVKETIDDAQQKISTLLKDNQIHFKRSSGEITTDGKEVLDDLIEILKGLKNVMIEVEGHTDAGGEENMNLNLSKIRAKEVKQYLIDNGLNAENITAQGFGETKLLLPETPFSLLNRRVEIYLKRK